jgi:hypothetical protein
VLARYVSDRHGCLPITPLIPYLGLLSPERGRVTYDDAVTAVGAKSYAVQIASEAAAGPTKQTLTFEVNENDGEARVLSSDPHGRLVTGVETSSAEVGVMLRNFPPGCVRVFAVRRQFGWRVGDPIGPVKSRAGAPVMVTTKVEEGKPRCQIAPSAKSR